MSTPAMRSDPAVEASPESRPAAGSGPGPWRAVAVKELKELLVTGRFQAAAALVFLLIAVTLAVMTRSYARTLESYGIAEAGRLASLREHGHLNRLTLWAGEDPPNPLTVLVSGVARDGRLHVFDSDALAIAYPPADLVMIIGIVLSLVAVLFAHDAFTGERERGTLRLLVAGTASRTSILFGKLTGRYLALLVPLVAGLMGGALVLLLSRDIGWGGAETAAFLVLAGVSAVFLAVFVALGILVSAWSRTTHGSLGLALAAWGTFILIIPSVAPYVAAAISPTENLALHQRRMITIMDTERDALIRELATEFRAPLLRAHPEIYDYFRLSEAERAAARTADPTLAAALEEYTALGDSAGLVANQRQREKRDRLEEAYDARRQAQVRLTERLASASPYPALVLASLDLTETGARARDRRDEQYNAWYDATFLPYLYATMDSLRAVDPGAGWNTRVRLTGVPWFEYAPEPVPDRLAAALPEAGALAAFGALFLIGGLAGFRRYDVR